MMTSVQRIKTTLLGFDVIFTDPPSYREQLISALEKTASLAVFKRLGKIRARYNIAQLPSAEAVGVHIRSLLASITTSQVFEWQVWPVWQVLVYLREECNLSEKQRVTTLLGSYDVSITWGENNQSFTLIMHSEPSNEFIDMINRTLGS